MPVPVSKPPDKCLACTAWEQAREDKMPGTGCGAKIIDKQRGCLKDSRKEAHND
jgi:hypothetical protein